MTRYNETRMQSVRRDIALAGAAFFGVGLAAATMAGADMAALDTDGDGLVSYTELLVVLPEVTEDEFASLDTDASGTLDEIEYTAAVEAEILPAE